jgi:fumarate reductase subunit C
MSETGLYVLQRLSAKILAPLVLVHLAMILYASHGGLTAAEILARTQGSVLWAVLYGLFVIAAAVHAPIGLRNVLREWTDWRGPGLNTAMLMLSAAMLLLGFRAVWAVVA